MALTKNTVSPLSPFPGSLYANQTCNYSTGQHVPHWPTVKYDHQFGPYPFITILPPPMGHEMLFMPRLFPPPLAILPYPTPFTHLTPLNCHAAKHHDEESCQVLSPCNELLSLLTPDRYPLEPTSTNHSFFSFPPLYPHPCVLMTVPFLRHIH